MKGATTDICSTSCCQNVMERGNHRTRQQDVKNENLFKLPSNLTCPCSSQKLQSNPAVAGIRLGVEYQSYRAPSQLSNRYLHILIRATIWELWPSEVGDCCCNFRSDPIDMTSLIYWLTMFPGETWAYPKYHNRRELHNLSDKWVNLKFWGGTKRLRS
jgi:hypothetical protein